eukprot:9666187-Lingulodinium_polyedra.AAC.1
MVLRLPALRYVDDFFGAEPSETARHALGCFARVARAVSGASALAEAKLAWGNALVVLGVEVFHFAGHISVRLDADKAERWRA